MLRRTRSPQAEQQLSKGRDKPQANRSPCLDPSGTVTADTEPLKCWSDAEGGTRASPSPTGNGKESQF